MFDTETATLLNNNEFVGNFRKMIADVQDELKKCKDFQTKLNKKAKAKRDIEELKGIAENARDKIQKARWESAPKEIQEIDNYLRNLKPPLRAQLDGIQDTMDNLKKSIQGEYTRLRDEVEAMQLEPAKRQTVMRELQNLKYDAESLITEVYTINNNLANQEYDTIIRTEPKNEHCVKDKEYEMRKRLTERVWKPISKYMYSPISHPGETEKDVARRRKMAHKSVIFVTEKMQESVSSLYAAIVEEDAIKRNLVEENCYKLLTQEESKWVFREVDMMRKKDSVDVYRQASTQDFVDLVKVVCMMLYAYDFLEGEDITEYMSRVNVYIDSLSIRIMQLMFVFPELVIFAFPIEEAAKWVHSVNISAIEHAIEYNDNWDLESAYMYWFWTHMQGEPYVPCVDPDGNSHAVPEDVVNPEQNYLEEVFKKKIKRIIKSTAQKLTSKNLYKKPEEMKIITPWNQMIDGDKEMPAMMDTGGDENYNSNGRSSIIYNNWVEKAKSFNKQADKVDTIVIEDFVAWFHVRLIATVPKFVWKSLNSLGGFKKLTSVPIHFLPNNYTLFDIKCEFWTSAIVILNTLYWTYGYLNSGLPQKIVNKQEAAKAASNKLDIYKGGLCYELFEDKIPFSVEPYDPFMVIFNPAQDSIPGVINEETAKEGGPSRPKCDYTFFGYNVIEEVGLEKYNYYYNWKTAGMSFMTMNMNTLFPIPVNEEVSFAGADCRMLPWEGYIKVNIELYKESGTNTYNVARNNWLFTYADFIMDKYANAENMLVNILYRATIPKLTKFHVTIPYNIIIDANYINYAHILRHEKGMLDTVSREEKTRSPALWEKDFAFPQHILCKSKCTVFKTDLSEKSVPERRTYDAPGYEYSLAAGDDIKLEMTTCKFAHA